MAEEKLLNIALFGLGRAGAFHLTNISRHPRVRLLWVVDVDIERAKSIAATYGAKYSTSGTGEEALQDANVNGVIIATPTPTHFYYIMRSLRAGKAVFSEKPVGYTLQEIDDAFNEAKKLGLPLLCGFNRRFDRSWVKAAEVIRLGGVGTPQIARSTARDSPVPTVEYLKTSHGFFHDSGVHDIDVIRWMMGEEPTEVFAVTHCYLEQIKELGDVDTIIIVLKFASGAMATIDLSRKSVYGYDQRVEIFGNKGMVQVENKPSTSVVVSSENGQLHDNVMFSFPQRFEEAYYLELVHFVEVVLEKAPMRVTHTDCRNVYIIAETAKKSSELGKPLPLEY